MVGVNQCDTHDEWTSELQFEPDELYVAHSSRHWRADSNVKRDTYLAATDALYDESELCIDS